jgi:hypothetical protein
MRSADGAVVFPARPTSAAAGPAPLLAGSPVQRAEESTGSASTAVAAGSGAASGVAATGAAATPDLSTLTELLYERIEFRLRSDLLHERERLGCLPDL